MLNFVYKVNMATSENAEELEVAVELQGKPKLIDPPASFRSAVWKYFGFPEVDGKVAPRYFCLEQPYVKCRNINLFTLLCNI
jgi:hypothetical protein